MRARTKARPGWRGAEAGVGSSAAALAEAPRLLPEGHLGGAPAPGLRHTHTDPHPRANLSSPLNDNFTHPALQGRATLLWKALGVKGLAAEETSVTLGYLLPSDATLNSTIDTTLPPPPPPARPPTRPPSKQPPPPRRPPAVPPRG